MTPDEKDKLLERALAAKADVPVLRSCWNCNPAHEYLKNVDYPFLCLWGCGHWFFEGHDLSAIAEKQKHGGSHA